MEIENYRQGRSLKLVSWSAFLLDSTELIECKSYIDEEVKWTNGLDASAWTDNNVPLPVRYAMKLWEKGFISKAEGILDCYD